MDSLKSVLNSIFAFVPPVHPAGFPFILVFVMAAFLLGMLWTPLGWMMLVLTVWCVYFFRNPDREVPQQVGLVVSPADGVVSDIRVVTSPEEIGLDGEQKWLRISIFLNVFNVHVNRVPIAGVIKNLVYFPGKFLNANLDNASDENERQICVVETTDGTQIVFAQVAGLIARRIICDLKDGQNVTTGERFGLIRFGSRTDIYLPEKTLSLVAVGQTMIGGESVLADLKNRKKRTFETV